MLGQDGHRLTFAASLATPSLLCRRLARQHHPDKNPQGRDKFLAVQKAYERLQAGAAKGQGPQAWRLLLILQVTLRHCLQQLHPACRGDRWRQAPG